MSKNSPVEKRSPTGEESAFNAGVSMEKIRDILADRVCVSESLVDAIPPISIGKQKGINERIIHDSPEG